MQSRERFSLNLIIQVNQRLIRREQTCKDRFLPIRISEKSTSEIRAAFKHAAMKLKTG